MNYFSNRLKTLSLICSGMLMLASQTYADEDVNSATENFINQKRAEMDKEQEGVALAVEMYPFVIKSSIAPMDVAGLKFDKKNITSFSYNGQCALQQNNDKDFSFNDYKFFSQYSDLQSVELSDLELTAQRLENLQKFLPRKLKGLAFSNCDITKKETPRLVDIIKTRQGMMSLTMSFPRCSSRKSTMFLEALDQYGDMRFINLTFGHINTEGAKMIAEVLKNSSNTLQSLTLAIGYIENDDDNEGINVILDAISSLKNLKQLEISFLELNEDACYKLFEIIGNFTDLRQLRLYIGNHEDYDQIKLFNGCEVCRDSIETMKKLEVLDISLMNLPESYMQLFAQSVAYLPELRTLNISGNRLDEKGAEIFTNSFKNTDKLDVLMANSCNMDSQIFTTLCRSLNATSLREGYFSNNHIKEGIKGLPISSMKDLLVLDLSHNDISYSELNSFIESFNNATSVKVINLRGNFEEERDNNVLRNFQCDHLEQWKLKTFSDGRAPALLGAYS